MRNRSTASKSRVRRTPGFSQRLARYSVGTLALAGSAGLAHADFSGPYAVTSASDPANVYTLSGNETFGTWSSSESDRTDSSGSTPASVTLDDSSAPASLTLSDTSGSVGEAEETFGNVAATAGTLSFSYTASFGNGFPSGVSLLVNGTATLLNGSGTISGVALAANETFAFQLNSYYGYTATLTVSNFSVPEPGTAGWIAAGAAGLLATRALRRRNARVSDEG